MFRLIQGFSKYEISETGIIRNVKTKMIVTKEQGGTTCRMIDDSGVRKSVKISEIKAAGVSAAAPKKEAKKEITATKAPKKVKEKKEAKERGKLSDAQTAEIRTIFKKGDTKQKDLAARFKVHPSTISEIINLKTRNK